MATLLRPLRVGVFSTLRGADLAVGDLAHAGFTREQISVVCSDRHKEQHFAAFHHEDPAGTTTPRNVAVGGAIGAALGGLVAVAGAVAATGGGALLFAGGASAWAGGVVGGLIGAMMSRGVENELANFYDQSVQSGKILVAVDVGGDESVTDEKRQLLRLQEADAILAHAGAEPLPMCVG